MRRLKVLVLSNIIILNVMLSVNIYGEDFSNLQEMGFEAIQKIYTNTVYSTNLNDNNLEKWYKFSVSSDGKMSIDLKCIGQEADTMALHAAIYGEDSSYELVSYNLGENTENEFGISAGTWYLKINTGNSANINCKFKINYVTADNWEKESNNSYEIANELPLNKEFYGSLQRLDDVDWYKFIVPETGKYEISFGHEYKDSTSLYWRGEIYDSLFNEKEEIDYTGNVQRKSVDMELTGGEVCYIKIASSENKDYWLNSVYSLKITSDITGKEGWKENDKGWWYQNSDESYPKNEWKRISEKWYYFDEEGYMQTGWLKLNDKWYYLEENGAMYEEGWHKIGENWYYMDQSGAMESDTWIGDYYVNDSGIWDNSKGKMTKEPSIPNES